MDSETLDNTYLDNGSSQVLAQGAGIETAQRVADAGAEAVLSGYVGPKAFEALKAAGYQQPMDIREKGEWMAIAARK